MAEALARGFMDRKVIEASDIWCCDPSKARMEVFANFGATGVEDAVEVRLTSSACLCTLFSGLYQAITSKSTNVNSADVQQCACRLQRM